MKYTLIKKIAFFMCAVMLFCAVPFSVSAEEMNTALTDEVAAVEMSDSEAEAADETTEQQDKNIFEIVEQVLAMVKKVIGALFDYFEEAPEGEEERPLSESGIAGYLFDPIEKCFYTASDPWQRVVGYNEIFDIIAPPMLITFDTIRFSFDYDEKNWIIQVWKGQYGALFYGAEIGIYNKPADRWLAHYDSVTDEERLQMSMDFYEYEERIFGKSGWEKKFSRPYDYYWWCTGFIPGNKTDEFDKLRVDARITAKDYEMLTALTSAMDETGISYDVSGLDITFTFC